jgi:hypothetical protein
MRSTLLTFVAEIAPARRAELDHVLSELAATASRPPFRPFAAIPTLHFASIVPFDTPQFSSLLVLESNFDGELDDYLAALLGAAEPWLRRILACCTDPPSASAAPSDLASYLRGHVVRPAAYHVGNVGRSVTRIRQEQDLRVRLATWIDARAAAGERPATREGAWAMVDRGRRASTDFGWVDDPHARQTLAQRAGPWVRLIATAFLALLFSPGLLPVLLVWLAILRRHEARDVPMPPSDLDPEHVRRLAAQEDHIVQNHLASLTVVKPGWFRALTLRVVLWAANLVARTSTKGTLSGIPSIHYAHWALVDRGRRLLFLSNFDGSWESYLDDFIDKASPGLTAIWTNTVGFPRTRFLVGGGARDGVAFKAFARWQQVPAAVWYSAYDDLTVQQIDSNSTLREGLAAPPRGAALGDWLRRW